MHGPAGHFQRPVCATAITDRTEAGAFGKHPDLNTARGRPARWPPQTAIALAMASSGASDAYITAAYQISICDIGGPEPQPAHTHA